MAEANTYEVEVLAEEGGPEQELRERWAICAARQLASNEEDTGLYPEAGGTFEILDSMQGKFLWEMTDADFEANPPTAVLFEIVSIDPAEAPSTPGTVRVEVRVPF